MKPSHAGNERSLNETCQILVDASKKAMVQVIRTHQAFDQPIVGWENGQVVLVDPFDERFLTFLKENSTLRPIHRVLATEN